MTNRGFTLLLATLTASLLLILAASMYSIVSKGLTLSSIGRDSQFAFYAADTGAECALYWDFRHDAFVTDTPDVECDEQPLSYSLIPGTGSTEFDFEPNGFCSRVRVTKSDTAPHSRITARGYNLPCADIAGSPRALERAVELFY